MAFVFTVRDSGGPGAEEPSEVTVSKLWHPPLPWLVKLHPVQGRVSVAFGTTSGHPATVRTASILGVLRLSWPIPKGAVQVGSQVESQSWAPVGSLRLDREQVICLPRMKAAPQLCQAWAPGNCSLHQVPGLQSPRAWSRTFLVSLCFCVTTNGGLSFLPFLSYVAATKLHVTTEQLLIWTEMLRVQHTPDIFGG